MQDASMLESLKHAANPSTLELGADTFELSVPSSPWLSCITTLSASERLTGTELAEMSLKVTVPKSAKGKTPPENGASSITSTDSLEDLYLTTWLQVSPLVSLVIESVHEVFLLHLAAQLKDAVMTSPGLIMSEVIGISAPGSISYQA